MLTNFQIFFSPSGSAEIM